MDNYKVRVSKKLRGELALPFVKGTLLPGRTITITPEQYASGMVKSAILRGYLIDETEKVEIEKAEVGTEKAKVGKVGKGKKKLTDLQKTIEEAKKGLGQMVAWDIENQKPLNQKESSQVTLKQVNSSPPDLQVKVGKNIELADDDTTDNAEETTQKILKKRTKSVVVSGDPVDAVPKKRGRKPKSLAPVGEVKVEPKAADIDFDISPSDLSFVDVEQTTERVKNHPILGKKISGQNEEIE